VEGGPLAAVGVIGLECRRRLRVVDDHVDAIADLFHDPEAGLEVPRDPLLPREALAAVVAPTPLGQRCPPCQVVVVGLQGAASRQLGESGASCACPTRLLLPGLDLRRGGRPLIAHVDRRGGPLEDVQMAGDLGQLRDGLDSGRSGADDADPLAPRVDVVVPP